MDNQDSYLNLDRYKQVLQFADKPSTQEFLQVAKIAAAGIGMVGIIGFTIFVLMSFLPG